MNKEEITLFWRRFFTDLFLGTFYKLFLFGLIGLALGMCSLYVMDHFFLEELELSDWIVWTVLVFSFCWYIGFGILYSLIACIIQIVSKNF